MLGRIKLAGFRALCEVASLPLRVLGRAQRGRALEKLTAAMVSEVAVPKRHAPFRNANSAAADACLVGLVKRAGHHRVDRRL